MSDYDYLNERIIKKFDSSNISTAGLKKMAKLRTILYWGRDDLLSCSVEFILTTQKEWRVVSISKEEKIEILMQAVDKINPDVLIVQKEENACFCLPTELFYYHPTLKVITANLKDNMMEVYSKQNVLVTSTSEFISLVESNLKI